MKVKSIFSLLSADKSIFKIGSYFDNIRV